MPVAGFAVPFAEYAAPRLPEYRGGFLAVRASAKALARVREKYIMDGAGSVAKDTHEPPLPYDVDKPYHMTRVCLAIAARFQH